MRLIRRQLARELGQQAPQAGVQGERSALFRETVFRGLQMYRDTSSSTMVIAYSNWGWGEAERDEVAVRTNVRTRYLWHNNM